MKGGLQISLKCMKIKKEGVRAVMACSEAFKVTKSTSEPVQKEYITKFTTKVCGIALHSDICF